MKNNRFTEEFHIGRMLKEEARQKGATSKQIAEVISHYRQHPDKIFKMKDMDMVYVVKISYLLKTNLLGMLVKKYKSYLPDTECEFSNESFNLVLNLKTNRIKADTNEENFDFLEKIDVGSHIEAFANKNNWTQKYVADRLGHSQSSVSDLYKSKSIKVKKLFYVSSVLQHDFISEIYLSKIRFNLSVKTFDNCIISVNEKEINIKKPIDNSFLMIYRRQIEE